VFRHPARAVALPRGESGFAVVNLKTKTQSWLWTGFWERSGASLVSGLSGARSSCGAAVGAAAAEFMDGAFDGRAPGGLPWRLKLSRSLLELASRLGNEGESGRCRQGCDTISSCWIEFFVFRTCRRRLPCAESARGARWP